MAQGSQPETALIVGAGSGLSASFARLLEREGFNVALAARNPDKLQTRGLALRCDATDAVQIENVFKTVEAKWGVPHLVLYNASYRTRGPIVELDPAEVEKTLAVTAFGGFLVAQEAAKRMLRQGRGTILFTGASASVKGYAQSAPFAMGKFALRGLAQSMARELQPHGIHVAHVVIDGGIRSARRSDPPDKPDSTLDPDAIAQSYLHLLLQPRNAWAWEIELRPWVERF